MGEYASSSLTSENRNIEVYAIKQLEEFLRSRLSKPALPKTLPRHTSISHSQLGNDLPIIPPSPAGFLKQLAKEIDSSIRFYEIYSGPFPFRNLGVSQIPGAFGQGWPGLLYLSTLSIPSRRSPISRGSQPNGPRGFSPMWCRSTRCASMVGQRRGLVFLSGSMD